MYAIKMDIKISNQQGPSNRNSVELRRALNSIQGVKASDRVISRSILSTIPLFNDFMAGALDTGNGLTKFIKVTSHASDAMRTASATFGVARFISAAIDLFRIPIIFIGAKVAGEKLPFTLSNTARFLYSSVIFGLTVTAFVFPPSALVIGLVSAFAAVGSECVALTKLYMKRESLEDQLEKRKNAIDLKRAKLNGLINEVEQLEGLEHKDNDSLSQLHQSFDEHLAGLKGLLNAQEICQQKLDKLGPKKLMNNAISIILPLAALIGTIVSLAVPPVGVGILAITATLGLTYFVGNLAHSLIQFLRKKPSAVQRYTSEHPEIELMEFKPQAGMDNSSSPEVEVFSSPLASMKRKQNVPLVFDPDGLSLSL